METSNLKFHAEGTVENKSTWKYELIVNPNNKFVLNFNLSSWNGPQNFEDRSKDDWIYEGNFTCSKRGLIYILDFSDIYKSGTSQANGDMTGPKPIAREQYTKGMSARISQNGTCDFKKEKWGVAMKGSSNIKEFFETHYPSLPTPLERYVSQVNESEKYPFNYANVYNLDNEPYCHFSNCLTLNPDGTFKARYLIGQEEGHTTCIEYEGFGSFSYNVQSRVLTLTRATLIVGSCYDDFKERVHTTTIVSDIIEKNYPATMEIPNFTWLSSNFNWPYLRLIKPFPEANYKELNVELYRSDTVTADAFYKGTLDFDVLCDKIKTFTTLTNFASTISAPVSYDETTLSPDGTFTMYEKTSSWASDMPEYCWDSYVSMKGKWNYDNINRVLTLTYESFNLNDDGKILNPSSFQLFPGKTLVSEDFYFESNYMYGIYNYFSYATPTISERWIKKKQ
jgi:hypothetical protein